MTRGSLLRATSAEWLKLRRAPALGVAIAMPFLVAMVFFLVALNLDGSRLRIDWKWLTSSVMGIWCLLALPQYVALQSALLAQLEHRNGQWKHLFALPVSRFAQLTAKILVAFALLLVTHATLGIGIVFAGLGLRRIDPTLAFDLAPPVGMIAETLLAVALAASLMCVIHMWVSIRWSSFVGTLALALFATAMLLGLSTADHEVWPYFPWSLPVQVTKSLFGAQVDWHGAVVSVLGAAVALPLAVFDLSRRDVTA